MDKLLYLQDWHLSGKNPINRNGDYFTDCIEKLKEILEIAKQKKVDAILDGGDLYHSPIVSYKIIDTIADLIEKYKIPIYSLFGNHAALYQNIEESENTSLGHLFKRCKYFKYISHFKCGNQFEILPIDYKHGIEEELKVSGLHFENKKRWKIAIVHAFVTPKPFLPNVMHVVCDDIKTNADLVLVAHYHSQWQKKIGNTEFLDIGCLGRRAISEANIEPSVLLLDTDNRSYEIIKLKSAKKGFDIFDLSKKEELKVFNGNLENFISSLQDMSIQSQSLRGVIEELGKRNNIDKKVIEIVVIKIQENENER